MAEEAEQTPENSGETEQQQETTQAEGLLDDVKIPEPEAVEEPEEIDHIDKAASGEKPDWLPDRFWNDEKGADYEALAKSQDELYKKLRNGKHQAPENGEYDLKFVGEKIPEDDEMLVQFKSVASERGLTQDDFESIVSLVVNSMPEHEKNSPEEKFDREAEYSKLGPNGEEVVNGVVKWATGLVEKGAWTREDFDEFKIMAGTAGGIRAFNRVRSYYGEKTIPVASNPDSVSIPTEEELQALVADPKYNSDPAFRRSVQQQFQKAFPSDGHSPAFS